MSAMGGSGGGHRDPNGRLPLKGTFFVTLPYLDKAPHLSISIVIWILSSLFVSSTNSIQIVRRRGNAVYPYLLLLGTLLTSQKHSAIILCILTQCNSNAFAVFARLTHIQHMNNELWPLNFTVSKKVVELSGFPSHPLWEIM